MVHTTLVEWAGGNSHKEESKAVLFLTAGAHHDVRAEGRDGACNDHAKD